MNVSELIDNTILIFISYVPTKKVKIIFDLIF